MPDIDPPNPKRSIRSFVRREGRITPGQQRALDEMLSEFGVAADTVPIDWAVLFGRKGPVIMEIGFGNGLSLADMAEANPEQNFLGVEVYRPGLGSMLVQIRERGLSNVRVSGSDAVDVLTDQVPQQSLDRLQIFFPDPWHKKRHNKRRIIQPGFVAMATQRLKPGGRFHVATDWEPYAQHILEVLEAEPGLINSSDGFAAKPNYRPQTKYELRGERLGHGVWDIVFQRGV
jgi:tRNA (guanine-N7-)-methyltransferase